MMVKMKNLFKSLLLCKRFKVNRIYSGCSGNPNFVFYDKFTDLRAHVVTEQDGEIILIKINDLNLTIVGNKSREIKKEESELVKNIIVSLIYK